MPFSLPFWAPKRKWGTGAKPRIHQDGNQKKIANIELFRQTEAAKPPMFFRFLFGHQKGSGERGQRPEYTGIEIKNKKANKQQLPDFFDKKCAHIKPFM